ncbi:MAG: hypothetical protein ACP5T5_01765 [Thermoprotei archaeon]|nr:hypothetical protein [TACK group archaeon]
MARGGSVVLGSVVGFLLIIVIGWVPFIGALIAGFVAGLIARGAWRGFIAGLGASLIGFVIITLAFALAGGAIAGFVGAFTFGLMGLGISVFLAIISLAGILLAAIGGALGGLAAQSTRSF